MKLPRTIAFVLVGLIHAKQADTTSLRNIGPLAHVDQVSIDILVGNALGPESDRGTPLFDADRNRGAEFESSMLSAATAHLRAAGVRVVKPSDNVVSFSFFGGKFKSGGRDTKNFFMVQVYVCVGPGSADCTRDSTLLGVVDDAALPQALTDAALEVLDEIISARAAFRQWSRQK